MIYGVFSDTHSNLEALEAVLEAYKQENIGRYLCIGDIVGYAASPAECMGRIVHLVDACVAGNHDFGCVGLFDIDNFSPAAREAILWTEGQLNLSQKSYLESLRLSYQDENLTLVHGSLFEPEQFHYLLDEDLAKDSFALQNTPVCFIGHSHVSGTLIQDENRHIYYTQNNFIELETGKKYIINSGSVGQPRDGDPRACYCVYDSGKKQVSIKRVGYDIQKTQKKIINAGLPRFLAERLSKGA